MVDLAKIDRTKSDLGDIPKPAPQQHRDGILHRITPYLRASPHPNIAAPPRPRPKQADPGRPAEIRRGTHLPQPPGENHAAAAQRPRLNIPQYDVTNDSPRENRSIVAIFDSPDAAQRAIASSPITVTLAPTALPTTKAELATGSPSENGEEKTVQFTIEPSRHNHAASLKRNPFYSTYNLFKSNPIFDDMMQRDTGVPLKALADVLQSKKYYITAGVRNKVQEENRRLGAYSLMELWEEGKEWEMEKKSLSGYEVDGETKQGQDTEDVK
ncbi:hypothetical protein N7492_001021 [Penicillium capsulatum]|uniref:Uncharacterized protein n=1 Tax=Penicillium capsulatum TaxID=69766 RepID=A0A9W9IUQ9_9EURO|nr:hypothetical protein N7492_001021 [Penicillium capsulatum]